MCNRYVSPEAGDIERYWHIGASQPWRGGEVYAAITRLKQDDGGCFLTVVCSAPQLREFGETWQ